MLSTPGCRNLSCAHMPSAHAIQTRTWDSCNFTKLGDETVVLGCDSKVDEFCLMACSAQPRSDRLPRLRSGSDNVANRIVRGFVPWQSIKPTCEGSDYLVGDYWLVGSSSAHTHTLFFLHVAFASSPVDQKDSRTIEKGEPKRIITGKARAGKRISQVQTQLCHVSHTPHNKRKERSENVDPKAFSCSFRFPHHSLPSCLK